MNKMKSCHIFIVFVFCIISHSISALQEISSEQEFYQVTREEQPVVAIFYASWSSPSSHMLIILDDIESNFQDVTFIKVNTDNLRHLATTV